MEAITLARFIISYSTEIGKPVSNLKLQKLLYFTSGLTLSVFDKPAFEEAIEAWQYGPVVPEVYAPFSLYGALDIDRIFDVTIDDEDIKNSAIYIIHRLEDRGAFDLVNETHKLGSPWEQVYDPQKKRCVIEDEAIKEYFKKVYLPKWFSNEE